MIVQNLLLQITLGFQTRGNMNKTNIPQDLFCWTIYVVTCDVLAFGTVG